MKLNTPGLALLATAFLASVSRPVLSLPVLSHVGETGLQLYSHAISPLSFSRVPPRQLTRRDEDESYVDIWKDHLEARGFPGLPKGGPPRAPPPPPLPAPRPAAGAGAGAAGGTAGSRPAGVAGPSSGGRAGNLPAGVSAGGNTPPRKLPPAPQSDWKPIPDNVIPGYNEPKGDPPRPMGEYEATGSKQIEDLALKIKSNDADTIVVENVADLSNSPPGRAFLDINKVDGYSIDVKPFTFGGLEEKESMDVLKNFVSPELGFSIKKIPADRKLQTIDITRKYNSQTTDTTKKDPPMKGDRITRGMYDQEGQFIVYRDGFKDRQTDIPDAVPLNEIGMQSFLQAAGPKTKNLQAAFLLDVRNTEFWGIIRNNYNDMKQPFEQVLTFERERDSVQFNRIMGSPNFRSKIFAYENHHNAIGGKVPEKVIVIPAQAPGSKGMLSVAVAFADGI